MTHVIYLNLSIYSSVRAYTAVNGDRDRVILCTTPCACCVLESCFCRRAVSKPPRPIRYS